MKYRVKIPFYPHQAGDIVDIDGEVNRAFLTNLEPVQEDEKKELEVSTPKRKSPKAAE